MTCGVDRCINPEHMKAETRQEINRKAARHRRSGTHAITIPDETVQRLVDLYQAGCLTVEIAERLGVSDRYITDVVRGKFRRAVTGRRSVLPPNVCRARRLVRGEAHARSKLTWQEVLVSVGLLRAGYTQTVVAENFGIAQSAMSSIKRGVHWKWLTGPLTPVGTSDAHGSAGRRRNVGAQHPRAVLTEAHVLAIVARAKTTGDSHRTIAQAYGVSNTAVGQILRGESWSWLTGIQPKATPARDAPHPDEALVWQHWRGGQRLDG
jgi:hypothetical protein